MNNSSLLTEVWSLPTFPLIAFNPRSPALGRGTLEMRWVEVIGAAWHFAHATEAGLLLLKAQGLSLGTETELETVEGCDGCQVHSHLHQASGSWVKNIADMGWPRERAAF